MILRAVETITWIKVEKPSFDLVGLILGALTLTGVLAAFALALGVVLGVTFIRRKHRSQPTTLHLDTAKLTAPLTAPEGRGTPA